MDVRESVRLAAIDKLNVLIGLTEIDDAGRTRKVPTMEDMYEAGTENVAPPKYDDRGYSIRTSDNPPTTH
ncbi:hypothetical protein [Caballeronia sp. M23-90]